MSTVRISDLPPTSVLNDDDFIVINTQNIVTQGIEAGDFIESMLARPLTFTGTVDFEGTVTVDAPLIIDGTLTSNNTVTFNDEVFFNSVTNLSLTDLDDVTGVPGNGQALVWDQAATTWKPGDVASGGGSSTLDDVVKNGNVTTEVIEVGGLKVGNVTLPPLDGSINEVMVTDGNGVVSFASGTLDGTAKRGAFTSETITVGGLVAASLVYPTTDGTTGQVLTTDGVGNLSFTSVTSGGSIPFGPNPPGVTVTGDLWLNSTNYKLYVWDGSWIATT